MWRSAAQRGNPGGRQPTEQAGQIAATATLDGNEMTLFDVKVDGDLLAFKLRVNEQEVVSFELHIDGDRMSGRFEGKDSGKATVSGTRASEPAPRDWLPKGPVNSAKGAYL